MDLTPGRQPDTLAQTWTLRFDGKKIRQRNSSFARRTRAALAGDAHVLAWRYHHAGHRPPLWSRCVPATPVSSVLVPVIRGGHGGGSAFIANYHQRHWCPHSRSGAAL